MTKTYAVIGDPIDHSLSPNIHNAAFKQLELDCTYIGYRIPRGELAAGIEALKKIQIAGFNVTIPHKIEIMKYLNKVDESCSIIGAANTVINEDGILKGYNTDMEGFLAPIKKRDIQIKNSEILLLGAGGAARAIVAGFAKEGAKKITITNRTKEKANTLAQFSKSIGLDAEGQALEEMTDIKKYNIIVNSTSLGLKNETSPIPIEGISSDTVVYDIVYIPINTDLIKKAKEKSATVIYGYEMLLGQAQRAFKIWHDIEAPYEAMKKAVLGGF